ncbi:hypothetical protein NSTCB13_00636 [Nostoc sp. DSM 114160]
MNIVAITLGFAIATLTGLGEKRFTAITVEVGIQNGTLAIAIASTPTLLNSPTMTIIYWGNLWSANVCDRHSLMVQAPKFIYGVNLKSQTCTERLVPTCAERSRGSGAEVSRSISNSQAPRFIYGVNPKSKTCTERLVPTCAERSRGSGAEVSRSISNPKLSDWCWIYLVD